MGGVGARRMHHDIGRALRPLAKQHLVHSLHTCFACNALDDLIMTQFHKDMITLHSEGDVNLGVLVFFFLCIILFFSFQEEGMLLCNLSALPDGALYKDSITRFWGPKPHGLPYHIFSHGDIVLISKHAPGSIAAQH